VLIDSKPDPYFLTGDFNGDFSQDLIVTVKPDPGRLQDINDELANWILVDPLPRPLTEPVRIDAPDALLAVIHGFGSEGWRNRDATQTYVIKRIADSALISRPHDQAVTPQNEDKLPRVWGDVIEQTISGRPGFLYFNGARYAWFDPAHPVVAHPRLVHQ
jgi:hypothetical protein